MKIKSLLVVVVLVLGMMAANAQMVVKGDKIVNLGLGLGTNLYSGHHYSMQIPPISVSGEYVIMDNLIDGNVAIGLGGYLGFRAYKYDVEGLYGWKYKSIVVGPRGYAHYSFMENLDTYAGITLGYNVLTSKYYGSSYWNGTASSGGIVYAFFIGGRYYFSDKLAAMAELGYGITYLNIGVAIKL
jgi:hypothetical protein